MKGLAALAVTAVVIIGSVVGLRFLIAPAQPTFADAVAAADSGEAPFLPEAVGGEFQVTGDRQGSFSLTEEVGPPGFGLGGDDGRMHFDSSGETVAISQFSYDGLDFFPDPGECTITPGEVNTARGVAAAQVSCPDIRDIRDNATITLEGRVGLPAAMVADLGLPDPGGTLAVGEQTWQVTDARFVELDAAITASGPPMGISGEGFALEVGAGEEGYTIEEIHYQAAQNQVPDGACSVSSESLGTLSPEAAVLEVTIDCEPVPIEGLGEVPITGSVVVEQLRIDGP